MMRRTTRFYRCAAVLVLSLLFAGACSKKTWIPEEKEALYKAEVTNLPKQEAIHIKKQNDFAWTNVYFALNKEYIFSATEIPSGEREILIPYKSFLHKDTDEPFPVDGEVWRLWIEGDEGYWYAGG